MYLDRIVVTKREEVARLQERPRGELEALAARQPAARGFERALRQRKRQALGLIAEVKKASPSKGLIRADFDPVALAEGYVQAGADCLSVLTDEHYFQGSNDYLRQVRVAVDVPLLRKDFVIDERQVYEARAIGADAVLLIAAILTTEQMRHLLRETRNLGMDALIEVHDRAELERTLALDGTLVGINNRNLQTFVTDLAVTEQLMDMMPAHVVKVSESGIAGTDDIARLTRVGVDAVLIGEHFMRQPSVADAVNALLGPVTAG